MEKKSFIVRLLDTKPQEVFISYEVKMADGSSLPSGISANTVFLKTQSISNIDGSYAFDVKIPYGYTGRVLRYKFIDDGTVVDFTAENNINDGYPLGTEPVYDENLNPILTEGPSKMIVFSTFYDDKVTEDRRIIVELTSKKADPIFDMHSMLTFTELNGRGSTGTINQIGGTLWPNIITEDVWDWNKSIFAKNPRTLTGADLDKYHTHWIKETDGSYTLDLVFQTNTGDYILNTFELNKIYIEVPFIAESSWNGSTCIENRGEWADGSVTQTIIDDALITLRFIRQFNGNSQRVYRLTIQNARTNFTLTFANLAMAKGGAPEWVAETLTGVGIAEDQPDTYQMYYNKEWHTYYLSNNVVLNAAGIHNDSEHYDATLRFKVLPGYETPSYYWKALMSNTVIEGTVNDDNTIREGSIIPWDEVNERLNTDYIYGPDEEGWYYVRIEQPPSSSNNNFHFMSLNIVATKISYIIRYMSDVAADNMPMFDPNLNPWDQNKDKIVYVSGAHIAEYDDNDGNFYDVVDYPNVVIVNATPTDKQNTRRFSHWSVVDEEDNISDENPIVRINTALKIADLAPYAIKLAKELGGKDYIYYVVRLKAVWEQGIKIQ